MGYRKTINATFNRGTIQEATVTHTADICQLLLSGNILMIDKIDLPKAMEGQSIHALIMDTKTGDIRSNKYYKFTGKNIQDDQWSETEYYRTYETEFDYS